LATRIDMLLGKEIFQRMQDILPRDIGIMVGISDTSGKPITGKRRYETSIVCRELINPCLKRRIPNHKPYSCVDMPNGCTLKEHCRGGLGNMRCEEYDRDADEQAIKTDMTVLYQCYFGLSNYAIPVRIGGLCSIALYGGQFTVKSSNNDEEIALEEFDEYGQKILIPESSFRKAVHNADVWRKNQPQKIPPHLSYTGRKDLISRYLKDQKVPVDDKQIRVKVGQTWKNDWPIERLENLLSRRYDLSVFEPWEDFLNPLARISDVPQWIKERKSLLSSYRFCRMTPSTDYRVQSAAEEALRNFENDIGVFLNPARQETLANKEYQEAIIPLRKVLSTIEILKELAILISRTASVMFYKDTYLMLKQAWINHPLSIVESYAEKWQECETRLQLLGTSGWESPFVAEEWSNAGGSKLGAYERYLKLVGELNRDLMFFAYKLLSDDFRSVISMLRYNYDIEDKYGKLENGQNLIKQTEVCFFNIRTASAVFIEDLLVDKYEQCAKKLRLAEHEERVRELETKRKAIRGPYLNTTRKIREKVEDFYTQESTATVKLLESEEVLSSVEMGEIDEWRRNVFKSLSEIYTDKSPEEMKEILQNDIMLKFFHLVFGGTSNENPQQELERLEVNLRWADAEVRNQIQNAPANVLSFDICQSLLQFVGRLREYVYTTRFEVIQKLSEKNMKFRNAFMPEGQTSCQYFIEYGIEHVTNVLKNVEEFIKFSQIHVENENDNVRNICGSPIWQYYVKSAALFHEVGIFSETSYESTYGGCAAVRHCHGAFSAKRIVEEENFALLGNDLDRWIIGQLCACQQNSADIGCFEKRLRILASILRIAGDFDVRDTRVKGPPSRQSIDNQIDKLYDTIVADLAKGGVYELSIQQIPRLLGTHKSPEEQAKETEDQLQFFTQLQKRIFEIAKRENQTDIWPANGTCVDLVNAPPMKKEASNFIEALRCCSEIKAILEATFQCQKHLSVKGVKLIYFPESLGPKKKTRDACTEIPQENVRPYLVPVISLQKITDTPIVQDMVTSEYQPKVVAKVKAEFKKEIDILKPYLEQACIRLRNPRVQELRSSGSSTGRNLLFINAPMATSKMKFIGGPTSLLYAISKISDKIDHDPDFMDVNIEIFDPICFGNEEKTELKGIIRDLRPKIIGVSNTSAGHCVALEIAQFIRDDVEATTQTESEKAIIIFGGPHENVCFDKTIERHHKWIDISIGGIPETLVQNNECGTTLGFRAEAEDILLKIVERVLKKADDGKRLSGQELIEDDPPLYENADGMFKIAYFDEQTGLQKKSSRGHALEINTLPSPPRHLLEDTDKYDYGIFKNEITGGTRKTAQVITTRGCIHRCTFCSSIGKISRRTIKDVIRELEKLRENGYEAIFFDDSTFADKCEDNLNYPYLCIYTGDPCSVQVGRLLIEKDEEIRKLNEEIQNIKSIEQGEPIQNWKEEQLRTEVRKLAKEKEEVEKTIEREGYEIGKCGYAIKLCNGMKRNGLRFVWGCQTRADVVHGKLVKAMRSAGCVYVYFGIESLNSETLKKMRKDIVPGNIMSGVETTRKEGVNVGFSLVFGLEDEDVEEAMSSLKELLKAPDVPPSSRVECVSINLITIYPGTKLEERMREAGRGDVVPDFDVKPQFDKPPFTEFEEGGWNILPCFASESDPDVRIQKSEDLAKKILEQSRTILGRRLVSSPESIRAVNEEEQEEEQAVNEEPRPQEEERRRKKEEPPPAPPSQEFVITFPPYADENHIIFGRGPLEGKIAWGFENDKQLTSGNLVCSDLFDINQPHIGSFQQTRTGKSTLAASVILQVAFQGIPVVVFDPKPDYTSNVIPVQKIFEKKPDVKEAIIKRFAETKQDIRGVDFSKPVTFEMNGEERVIEFRIYSSDTDLRGLRNCRPLKLPFIVLPVDKERLAEECNLIGTSMASCLPHGRGQAFNVLLSKLIQKYKENHPNQCFMSEQRIIEELKKLSSNSERSEQGRIRNLIRAIEEFYTTNSYLYASNDSELSDLPEIIKNPEFDSGDHKTVSISVIDVSFLSHGEKNPALQNYVSQVSGRIFDFVRKQKTKSSTRLFMIFDEAQNYLPDPADLSNNVRKIINSGASIGIKAWVIAQSPGSIEKESKRQFSTFILSQVPEDSVRKELSRFAESKWKEKLKKTGLGVSLVINKQNGKNGGALCSTFSSPQTVDLLSAKEIVDLLAARQKSVLCKE